MYYTFICKVLDFITNQGRSLFLFFESYGRSKAHKIYIFLIAIAKIINLASYIIQKATFVNKSSLLYYNIRCSLILLQ